MHYKNHNYNVNDLSNELSQKVPFFQSDSFLKLCEGHRDQFAFFYYIKNPGTNRPSGHLLVQVVYKPGLLRFFTTRAIIWHGPVLYDNSEPICLLSALKGLQKVLPWYTLFIQFRNLEYNDALSSDFRKSGFQFSERLNLVKPISPISAAWASLSESRKRQVRKSKANGLEIIREPTAQEIYDFYELLSDLYDRISKPLPTVAFFMKFYELSLSGEINGFISLARFQGKIVGGIVCPYGKTGRVYEYYIAGKDKELAAYKVYPSVALTWEGMVRGAELGCTLFDFMGLGVPERPYGVRNFKIRFGGQIINPGRWNKIINKPLYFIAELLYNLNYLIRFIKDKFGG